MRIDDVDAGYRAQQRLLRVRRIRRQRALEGELHIVRVEIRAIVKAHVAAQVEDIAQPVGRRLPGLGECRCIV